MEERGGRDNILSCVKVVQLNLIFNPSGLDFYLVPFMSSVLEKESYELESARQYKSIYY